MMRCGLNQTPRFALPLLAGQSFDCGEGEEALTFDLSSAALIENFTSRPIMARSLNSDLTLIKRSSSSFIVLLVQILFLSSIPAKTL